MDKLWADNHNEYLEEWEVIHYTIKRDQQWFPIDDFEMWMEFISKHNLYNIVSLELINSLITKNILVANLTCEKLTTTALVSDSRVSNIKSGSNVYNFVAKG